MNKNTKKAYTISRIIIPILTLIIFSIIFRNEESSIIKLSLIFVIISFLASFPSTIISTKLINVGDKIKNKILKVLYYVVLLPIIAIILAIIMYIIIVYIHELLPKAKDFNTSLGRVIAALTIAIIGIILILVPYVQTILVIIIKKIIKNKKN